MWIGSGVRCGLCRASSSANHARAALVTPFDIPIGSPSSRQRSQRARSPPVAALRMPTWSRRHVSSARLLISPTVWSRIHRRGSPPPQGGTSDTSTRLGISVSGSTSGTPHMSNPIARRSSSTASSRIASTSSVESASKSSCRLHRERDRCRTIARSVGRSEEPRNPNSLGFAGRTQEVGIAKTGEPWPHSATRKPKEASMTDDQTLTRAIDRVDAAMTALRSGEPEPYIDCWARMDDVTLYGAWGPTGRPLRARQRALLELCADARATRRRSCVRSNGGERGTARGVSRSRAALTWLG